MCWAMTSAASASRPESAPELPPGCLTPGLASLDHHVLSIPDSVAAAMERM